MEIFKSTALGPTELMRNLSVDVEEITNLINALGFSAKTALSGLQAMSDAMRKADVSIKKKKNWKAKTIWERV